MNAPAQTAATATTMATKQPIPITMVAMHWHPHFDEVVAYVILVMYGENLFPGISKAAPRFLVGEIVGTEAVWDNDKILPVGIGKGRFDEHRDGTPDGRIKGECAATLVAKYLGVHDNPELKQLLAETLEGDQEATNTLTQIAELMKVAYRHLVKDSATVFNLVVTSVRAIIRQQIYKFASTASERSLKFLWSEALQADEELKKPEQTRVASRIGQLIGESQGYGKHLITEFASVIEALYRAPYSFDEVIQPQFEFFLSAIKNDVTEFMSVTDKLKKVKPIKIIILSNGQDKALKLLVCKVGELQAPKAARSLGNQIILVRDSNSRGNFQIHTSKKWFYRDGVTVANLVRMIRFLSLPPEEKATVRWDELGCTGNHPDVPEIHYHKKAEAIYNGTSTHLAEPSEICTQALVEAIKYAFHPYYLKQWCNERGITMNPDRVAEIRTQRENNPEKKPESEVSLGVANDLEEVLEGSLGEQKTEPVVS